jgi:non-ribosomal peptide synthase protein (TIGR01720 family)
LPRKTTSFRDWAERLGEHAAAAETAAELGFWRDQLAGEPVALPVDRPAGANTVGDSTTVRIALGERATGVLLQRSAHDLLIAAAAGALARWSGGSEVALAVEGHGREAIFPDVDLSRTVGWFTTIFPVRLRLPDGDDVAALVAAVAGQLERIPRRGIGFGLLRYLAPDPAQRGELAAGAWPAVSFNYLGRLDRAGAPADPLHDVTGAERSGRGRRPYLIDLNAGVSGGRLWCDVHYSAAQFDRSTIERLADHLDDLIGAVATVAATPPIETPAGVSDRDVAALLDRLRGDGGDEP